MPDFESLDAIARTDALLDALASERRFMPADRDEQALVSILEGWRDDVRRHSDAVVTERDAAAALHDGLAKTPSTVPRGRRGLTTVTSIAAAVLCIGGFGAVVAGSGPGDSLYGLRTALFGEKASVRDDRVALAAQTEMSQVKEMINHGDWDQAQQKLKAVSTQVQSVDDVTTKTDLINQWNELSVKVGTRDAKASLPASTPGVPAAPPPPGVTLLEVPAVTTTTVTATQTPTSESAATSSVPASTSVAATTTPDHRGGHGDHPGFRAIHHDGPGYLRAGYDDTVAVRDGYGDDLGIWSCHFDGAFGVRAGHHDGGAVGRDHVRPGHNRTRSGDDQRCPSRYHDRRTRRRNSRINQCGCQPCRDYDCGDAIRGAGDGEHAFGGPIRGSGDGHHGATGQVSGVPVRVAGAIGDSRDDGRRRAQFAARRTTRRACRESCGAFSVGSGHPANIRAW